MRRIAGVSAALAVWMLAVIPLPGRAQTPAEFAQTATFVAAHQNKDGGFAAKVGQASSLGATNTALRVLLHVGGSVPDILGCVKYVKSCRDATGGFAPLPGGKPEVITTAVGLMAASELKIVDEAMIKEAAAFLGNNAHNFEEVRMAIAGLEAVHGTSPDFPRWFDQIQAMRNPDGTFGKGAEQAYATGGAAAAILRMGMKLDKRDEVIAAIKAGQRPEGAWSKDDGPPDLGSTYRVMRALYMLGEKPDVDHLLGFIARCRQSDGSYASAPGRPGDLAGTYTATIVIRWLRLLSGMPPVVETAGFTPLVNGNDLGGWDGDRKLWSAKDGVLIGLSPGLDHNEFLATIQSYGDFMFALDFRLKDGKGNSGVQFRSVRVPPHEMSGYQADIGEGYWASLYDESRRNKTLVNGSADALKVLNKADWNHYTVRAQGDRIMLGLNGKIAVNYRETDPSVARSGLLAVQIHAGGPMEIQFNNVMIQPLPSPAPGKPPAAGFHLRTFKAAGGDRKYTVYVPEGHDDVKVFPVILFLHGGGERGQDGVVPAQVGIGPAILNRPGGFPALVVFPQAREGWAPGSADITDALAALDDVMTTFKADPKRVILTGISMGGRGSWDLAAAHIQRFAAVVPVCGPGRTESLAQLRSLPVWAFCGDGDRDATVLNMRAMVEGLRQLGGTVRLTEYRGVGHWSWDRVYNDHEVIDWMLAQHIP
jgi:acetyl esterase/lipase/prenyltransferase beta subunit